MLPEVLVDVLDIIYHQLGVPSILDVDILYECGADVLGNWGTGSSWIEINRHWLNLIINGKLQDLHVFFLLGLYRQARLQRLLERLGIPARDDALAPGVLNLAQGGALQIGCA